MPDLVERLRRMAGKDWAPRHDPTFTEAADEIERLRGILREMLRPISPRDKDDIERFMREGDEVARRARAILGDR